MLSRIKFWVVINVYALFLDVMALMTFGAAYLLFQSGLVFGIIVSIVGAFLLYGAIGIHGTYPEKRRMYLLLFRKNARLFRIESFKNSMSVPCHRVLVRRLLSDLGRESEYPKIKKAYYRYPWQTRFPDDTVLHIFSHQV